MLFVTLWSEIDVGSLRKGRVKLAIQTKAVSQKYYQAITGFIIIGSYALF